MFYPGRESRTLEFKSELPKLQKLVKTCVAFANCYGGKLIIGVADNGEIIGVSEKARNRLYDEFPNSLYDSTSPGLLAEIYEQRLDDKMVVIIEVPNSIKKPVFLKEEGMPKGVYLRAGSSTRRATTAYVEELMREGQRTSFDEELIRVNPSILSKELLKQMFGRYDERRLLAEKVVTCSSVNSKTCYPTVAGVLCFCEEPEQYLPEAVIMCTKLKGTQGREILETITIRGDLEKQAEQCFFLLKQWLAESYRLVGVKLKRQLLVPEEALREAIINALLHRAYWVPGAIKIALFDDRLEIFSPGSFPGLVDLDNLGDGTTYLRNPHLAKLARRLGLIEKLGTGIRLMKDSCRAAGIRQPVFTDGVDSVKVVFSFLPDNSTADTDEDALLLLFKRIPEVAISEVASYLGVSRNTATRKLNQLIEKGMVRRVGKGPAVRYVRAI